MNNRSTGKEPFSPHDARILYEQMVHAYNNTDDKSKVPSTMKRIVRFIRNNGGAVPSKLSEHIGNESGIGAVTAQSRTATALQELCFLKVIEAKNGSEPSYHFVPEFLTACGFNKPAITDPTETLDVGIRLDVNDSDVEHHYVRITVLVNGIEFSQSELRDLTNAAQTALTVLDQTKMPEVLRENFYKEGRWTFGEFSCPYGQLASVAAYLENLPKLLTPVVGASQKELPTPVFVATHLSDEFKGGILMGIRGEEWPKHGPTAKICGYVFGASRVKELSFEHVCAYISNSGNMLDRPAYGECFDMLERVGVLTRTEEELGYHNKLTLTKGFIDTVAFSQN